MAKLPKNVRLERAEKSKKTKARNKAKALAAWNLLRCDCYCQKHNPREKRPGYNVYNQRYYSPTFGIGRL